MELRARHLTYAKISKALRRSQSSITNKIAELEPPPAPKARRGPDYWRQHTHLFERVRALRDQGWTTKEIAVKLRMTPADIEAAMVLEQGEG